MSKQYSIGLDYRTNSVRCLIVDVANGREVGTAVWEYAHGTHGVILSRDPNLARQHPADYRPLAVQKRFAKNPAALAWLGKDHPAVAEAGEITALAKQMRPRTATSTFPASTARRRLPVSERLPGASRWRAWCRANRLR